MEESKTYPMAFFTPIVEIAEAPVQTEPLTKDSKNKTSEFDEIEIKDEKDESLTDVKEEVESKINSAEELTEIKKEDSKEDTKDEDVKVKDEPKQEISTKEDNVVNKKKRGRPKKTDFGPAVRKSKRTYIKQVKPVEVPVKKEKKPRKQRSPKKKPPETNEVEIKFEDDVLISPEHLDENKVIKCPICKDDREWNLKEVKEHYKKEHPGKRLRTSRFFGDLHPCDICGKEFKSAGSLKDHVETHSNYFYCDICNHSTKKILDHILHLRIHHHMGIFQCLMCEFNTLEITKINDHVNHHEDLLKYWCDSCKKSFQILQHFQEHDNYHTGLKPFDCEFCGKCFLYSRYLHAHKINMHKEEMNCPSTYECVICNKIYQHRNSLKLHMNSHTGNFAICDICGKTLSSKEKLKFHLRTHTGYKPYSCQYCGKCFTKKPILVEHVRVHTGEKPYICDYCTKGFSQRSSLVIHMRGHTGEKPYGCQFCGKGFVAKAMLNIHLKTCKGYFQMPKTETKEICVKLEQDGEEILIQFIEDDTEQEYINFNDASVKNNVTINGNQYLQIIDAKEQSLEETAENTEESIGNMEEPVSSDPENKPSNRHIKKYLCNVCGGHFKLIIRHLETHGPHNCIDCLINFKTEALYDDHLMSAHNEDGRQRYSCEYCPSAFSSITNLAVHTYKHTQRYTCPICKFTVKGRYKNSLINHIKRHEGKYSMKCEICGQGFIEKNILLGHMEIHEAIPKYECEICKKKFTVKRYLDVHKSYNHKKELYGIEEVYQCEYCGRSFTFEKSLVRHLSCIHKIGEDRTVECPVCHKTIANNHNLKKHMRVHTGEKRFCCDTCGKAFSEKKYLKKHQNVHLKERIRKPKTPLTTGSDEDSNLSGFVGYNVPNEMTSQNTDYFVKNAVDDDQDNEILYFTME